MASLLTKAKDLFNRRGGILRTSEALAAGLHPRTLYLLRDRGELECLSRGVYRLSALPPLSEPDLTTVARRVPRSVVCLVSALAFHDLTTEIPHAVHLAMPRAARVPKLTFPPLRVFHFAQETFASGIETHFIDGVAVRIYSPEKTLADCFKFRNKIGLDIALEALRAYCNRRGARLQVVLDFARLCRVEKVVRPYLEANA